MSCTIFDFGGILMAICYDKLWKLLIDKKMNRTELKEASGISFNVLARMGKNEPVSFESIEKICFTLNCKIEDVVEIKKEESPKVKIIFEKNVPETAIKEIYSSSTIMPVIYDYLNDGNNIINAGGALL